MVRRRRRYEARQWLQTNANKYAFAGNRFGETINALNFVQGLYSLGARRVEVTNVFNEKWHIRENGGPYADTLIVTLPDNSEQRRDLIEIATAEMKQEGFPTELYFSELRLILWWD
jgi:hypothetical protein